MLTKEQWANLACKADWEGGWPEYIIGYGADADTIGNDDQFLADLRVFEAAWGALRTHISRYNKKYGECWQLENEL